MNVQPQLQMDNTTFLDWVQGREGHYELAEGRVMMMTGATMRARSSFRPDRVCLPAPTPRSAFRR
jgi:hypothetical protein